MKRCICWSILFVLFALLLASCSGAQDIVSEGAAVDQAAPTGTPTEVPTEAPTETPTAPPAPTETPEPVKPIDAGVAAEGTRAVEIDTLQGHLLIATSADGLTVDTIWRISADGQQARKLVSGVSIIMPWDAELDQLVSPNQTKMAVITTTDVQLYADLTLQLLDLATGRFEIVTPLTSPLTEPDPSADFIWDDPNFQVVRAITELNSVAWSPDGKLLAFMGAIDGPSSDLYVYSMTDRIITRLTDGPSQGIHPVFSPDGKYIVHAGVGSLGTGAGYSMEGVWAAAADGSEVISLYDPSLSGDEVFVGWESPGTLVVYSWSAAFGPNNLRRVSLIDQHVEPIYEGPFGDVAYDPDSGTAVITLDQYQAQGVGGVEPGVYFIAPDGSVEQIDKSDSYRPVFSPEAGAFFVYTSAYNAVQVNTDGTFQQLLNPTDRTPVVSADGYYRAWSSNYEDGGLWIGPGVDPVPVFDGPVVYPTWHPDSDLIAFISEGTLYFAAAENFDPILITVGIDPTNWQPVWID